MVVKYEYENPISTNLRRVGSINWLFGRLDGCSTIYAMNPIMYEPRSTAPLHVHGKGVEEVWIAVEGEIVIQLGLKRRTLPVGGAYKIPPDRMTPHANINMSDVSKKLIWIMIVPDDNLPDWMKQDNQEGIM